MGKVPLYVEHSHWDTAVENLFQQVLFLRLLQKSILNEVTDFSDVGRC